MLEHWAFPILGLGVVFIISLLGLAETVLVQVGLHRLRRLLAGAENGDEVFTPDEQARLLTTLLLIRTVLILLLGALATSWAVTVSHEPTFLLSCLLCTTLALVGAEVVIRRRARISADNIAARVLPIVRQVHWFFSPLVNFIFAITTPLSPRQTRLPMASLEDLQEEILELTSQGVLEDAETEMLKSVFDLGETIAREVMVPRVDMVCTQLGTPVGDVLALVTEHGYSRIPVFKESIDKIQGFVHVKDLIDGLEDESRPIDEGDLREVLIVPGTKKVVEILRTLQAEKLSMTVVLDEYGGTDGLLTLEDIVEEIVGEINDEYDREEMPDVRHLENGAVLLNANLIVEDVNEHLNVAIPVNGPETLAGFVFEQLGHVPEPGETLEVEGLRLTVDSVERTRIKTVKVEPGTQEEEGVREDVA